MTFQADEYQAKCMSTWYDKDDPLYLDPRHPLIALAGEAGELLDLYKKHEYKPGFSWWNCKNCGKVHQNPVEGYLNICPDYTPLVLDELGDYWYYLRILTWQSHISLGPLVIGYTAADFSHSLEQYLCDLSLNSAKQFNYWLWSGKVSKGRYQRIIFVFMAILTYLNCDVDYLTDLNCAKLNNATAHGWRDATVKSEVK